MSAWIGIVLTFAMMVSIGVAAPMEHIAPLTAPIFRHYGVADGLSSNAVTDIAQAKDGIMWFSTSRGVVRFDGVEFKNFSHDSIDHRSLSSTSAQDLLFDNHQHLWVAGNKGLSLYEEDIGGFRNWRHQDGDFSSLNNDRVRSVAQTVDGSIWVVTNSGLDHLRADGGFDHWPGFSQESNRSEFGWPKAVMADRHGLWIGTSRGIYLKDKYDRLHKIHVSAVSGGDEVEVNRIEEEDGHLQFSTKQGLLSLGADGVARPIYQGILAGVSIASSLLGRQGRTWVGSEKGMTIIDGFGRVKHLQGRTPLPGGLPGNLVSKIFQDDRGGLWVAFFDQGLGYLSPDWVGLELFTHDAENRFSIADSETSMVLANSIDGSIWVSGRGWVDKFDPRTGRAKHVISGLPYIIWGMVEDRRGRLWITSGSVLTIMERGVSRKIDMKKIGVQGMSLMVAASDGHIYASTDLGPVVIDPDSLELSPLPMENSGTDDILGCAQMRIRDGELWYASDGGLLHWSDRDKKMVFVKGVPRRQIRSFAFSKDGFWIATVANLEHYHYKDGVAIRDNSISLSEAHPGISLVAGIYVDEDDRVWLLARPGLWRFDPSTHSLQAFGLQQGLLDLGFSNDQMAVDPDGTVYAAAKRGLVKFKPRQLSSLVDGAEPPHVSLSKISVRRQGELHQLAVGSSALKLGWRDRDLRFEARVTSYVYPEANQYRYRLDGVDSDWVEVGSHGEREFTELGAGDYRLEVMARGPNGPWGRLEQPLRIHIDAPPWMRWWAWSIYLFLAAALAWLILYLWRRRLNERHAAALSDQRRLMAEQASDAKTRFLATLGHEIRTPMTGVMGMAELMLQTRLDAVQQGYAQAMRTSGSLLLKLVNDALDLARIEAGRLELDQAAFDPAALLCDVERMSAVQATTRGLELAVSVAPGVPAAVRGDAIRVKQVLLNLVGNALKFTEHGRVALGLRRWEDGLEFSVADTGPGIPEFSQARLFRRFEQVDGPHRNAGSGLGLAICRELVNAMGGQILLESRTGEGSTFLVRLPLPEVAQTPGAALEAQAPPIELRSLNVLLVEDDAVVAAVIGGLLTHRGHRVSHVVHGLAALAELAQGGIDAVLLNLDLPGVDGFQIVRLVRQQEAKDGRPRLPVIAITARSGGDEESRAYEAGMDGFLRKPLSGESVAAELAARVPVAS